MAYIQKTLCFSSKSFCSHSKCVLCRCRPCGLLSSPHTHIPFHKTKGLCFYTCSINDHDHVFLFLFSVTTPLPAPLSFSLSNKQYAGRCLLPSAKIPVWIGPLVLLFTCPAMALLRSPV